MDEKLTDQEYARLRRLAEDRCKLWTTSAQNHCPDFQRWSRQCYTDGYLSGMIATMRWGAEPGEQSGASDKSRESSLSPATGYAAPEPQPRVAAKQPWSAGWLGRVITVYHIEGTLHWHRAAFDGCPAMLFEDRAKAMDDAYRVAKQYHFEPVIKIVEWEQFVAVARLGEAAEKASAAQRPAQHSA